MSTEARILLDVADEFGVTVEGLLGVSRQAEISQARKVALRRVMYDDQGQPVGENPKRPRYTVTQLGRMFSRDHSTISYLLGRAK